MSEAQSKGHATEAKWFATRLRSCMDARGVNQHTLATLCGWTQAAISHYAGGRRTPSIRNALIIARALGVTLDELLGETSPLETRVAELERRVSALAEERQRIAKENP